MKLAGFYLLSILATQLHFVWGDATSSEYERQIPTNVSVEAVHSLNPAAEEAQAEVQISALFSYKNSCEKDGYYEYQVSENEIVVDSYKEVDHSGICLQKYQADVPVDFEIRGLEENQTYHLYFLDEDGDSRYVGDISTTTTGSNLPGLY